MNKKTNVFGGDQSNSSVIAKLRNNALQQATMSKKTKKTPADAAHALQQVRAGGTIVPLNVASPHTLSPMFPKAPVVPKNTSGNVIQQMALNRVRHNGCNSKWCT